MNEKKTLNDHLFDQLDRLSNATEENIGLETTKATHLIAVGEQVLNVARLKIDIMQMAGKDGDGVIQDQFAEIDQPSTFKQLPAGEQEYFDDDKKKDQM
jgi:hypothetical protein